MTLLPEHKIGGAASLVLVLSAIVWMQSAATPESPGVKPVEIVQQLDAHARADNWAQAHALMDYRSKGRDLVPDLWDEGTESAQRGLVKLLQDMFTSTWRGFHAHGDSHPLTQTEIDSGVTMVEQTVGKQSTALRYWLEYKDSGWTIVDRTSRTGRIHIEPSGKVNVVRNRIISQLGGQPITLSDFVANAPSWVKRVRARRFRVGDDQVHRK